MQNKTKYGLCFTVITFLVGSLWFPILCGVGSFNIRTFLVMGIASLALVWGGGAVVYLLMREKTQPST